MYLSVQIYIYGYIYIYIYVRRLVRVHLAGRVGHLKMTAKQVKPEA